MTGQGNGAVPEEGPELFTIEESHGKPRLTAPRPSDLGTVPTGEDRARNHNPDGTFAKRNKAAADRSAKRALTAPLRAASERVRHATSDSPASVQDELMANAMAVYASTRRELGTRSTLVLSSLAVHASESVLAGYFLERAASAGLETKDAARLIELAHSCQTQASRALVSALAAAKALGGKKRKTVSVVAQIERAVAQGVPAPNSEVDDGE